MAPPAAVPADGGAMPQPLILMADTRSPLGYSLTDAPFYALATAINACYAERHGYVFRFCHLTDGAQAIAETESEATPAAATPLRGRRKNDRTPHGGAASTVGYHLDIGMMRLINASLALPGANWSRQVRWGARYAKVKSLLGNDRQPAPASTGADHCTHRTFGRRAPAWGKLLAIQAALADGFDPVVYIDSDAVFNQPQYSLADFAAAHHLKDEQPLALLCNTPWRRHAEANSGFMMFRNTPAARELLQVWWDADAGRYHLSGDWEQHALNAQLLDAASPWRQHVHILDLPSLVEAPDQFIRHITGVHGWIRRPRLRLAAAEYGMDAAAFADRLQQVRNSEIRSLDVTQPV